MSVRIEHADMLEALPRLVAEGVQVDAVVTDPPYHLSAIPHVRGFHRKRDAETQQARAGFMGQGWDGGDIAFRPETWATVATIMRPGAFLVAFGGTRTYHRLACAIEDGGFVIQDCIMWLFATGFPKRRDNLKPAYEPIVLAYKPGGKRTMQIDECRISTEGETFGIPQGNPANRAGVVGLAMGPGNASDLEKNQAAQRESIERTQTLGRWPANICHDGSDEVLAAFPDSAGQQGDVRGTEPSDRLGANGIYGQADSTRPAAPSRSDSGSAARFFFSAKAGAQDRWGSRHPTVKPVELMKWLIPLVTPAGGLFLDPFAGSGTSGVAALATGRDCILIEREDAYVADIRERMAHYEGNGRHSIASKARQARPRGEAPLFDIPYDPEADARDSYDLAVREIGAKVKAGAPVPAFFLPEGE